MNICHAFARSPAKFRQGSAKFRKVKVNETCLAKLTNILARLCATSVGNEQRRQVTHLAALFHKKTKL
jgi:hypothetical protein